MSGSLHKVIAEAVVGRLAAALPSIPCERARRAEVEQQERPLLVVSIGDMRANPNASFGETFWDVTFVVTGFPAAASTDVLAEDGIGTMAQQIIEALDAQALPRPGGGDLTTGVFAAAIEPRLYGAEEHGAPMGEVSVTFRAEVALPNGVLSL